MSILEQVKQELDHWFFDVYFNHWVEVGNGVRDEGPEFVLQYWGTPMYATVDDPEMTMWLLKDQDVVDFLVLQHEILKEAGYSHTDIPEKRITAYHKNGGAIDVIWSRRAADETEIQRYVVHFEVVRMEGVWKVVGVQTKKTDPDLDKGQIDLAWAS